jgi:hypothetical protein
LNTDETRIEKAGQKLDDKKIRNVKLWKLTPIKLDSPHMMASWHKQYAIIRAPNEAAARELAKADLSIAVEAQPSSDTIFSPWEQSDIVTCVEHNGSEFNHAGKPAVLYPQV